MANEVFIRLDNMHRRADKRLEDPHVNSTAQAKEEEIAVDIINLSRRGLRFRSTCKHSIGDKIRFCINSNDKMADLSLSIKAKVVNDYTDLTDDKPAGAPEGVYDYGVKFYRMLFWYEMNCIHDYVYRCEKEREAKKDVSIT